MNPAQRLKLYTVRRASRIGHSLPSAGMFRLCALLVLVVLIGGFVYSSSLASGEVSYAPDTRATLKGSSPAVAAKAPGAGVRFQPNYLNSEALAVAPLLVDGVTIQESTCATAQTNFNLNQTLCITSTGFVGQRIVVVDPQNLIRDSFTITTSPQVESFLVPNEVTTPLFGGFLDANNLGTWHVYIVTGRGVPLAGGDFVVKDTDQATANVDIFASRTGGNLILAGEIVTYDITIVNYGPDAAANVVFTSATPSFTTFSALTVPAGPGISCTDPGVGNTGNVVCTVASLAANTRLTFTAQFEVDDVGAGSSIGLTATVTTDTANISDNTTASSDGSVSNDGEPTGCTLTCPANITVTEDTTGPDPSDPTQTVPGAIVTFAAPTTNGTCGTLTSSPASGSFFPRGTTPVTSSSSQGGAECSFTVTVTQSGNAVSIACPANKVANADENCSAIVALGTPTTTGDDVTITANRSDGKPMYDCQADPVTGEPVPPCVRKSQDLPFPAGRTVVTWTATNSSGSQSCTQNVRVYDVTLPTITAANQTVSADASCQAAVPDFSTSASVSDNCACASSDTSEICDSREDIVVTQSVAPGTMVGLGTHTIQLTANDGAITPGPDAILGTEDDILGNISVKTITFTVSDTTPPEITAPAPVIASTGPGATTCDTIVSDATLGTPTTSDNCGPITVTRSPSGNTFPVGTTTVVWTATDGAGNQATASQTVTVTDNTVPVITLNGQTPSMWPPNHKYKTFTVTNFVSSVFDNCGGVSVSNVVIDNVTSDETENGNGDGNTNNDIIIASDCKSVQLRSERQGGGDGRVYTITFRLTDTHGNTTTVSANVVVVHNPGQTPVNSGVHYSVSGSCN